MQNAWNTNVTLGDGRRARLVPLSSWSRIYNADGSLHCNHDDTADCPRSGHETVQLYEVVIEGVGNPEWGCVCGHVLRRHREVGTGELVGCHDCECPGFCSPADADEIAEAVYEDALADAEDWAVEAHDRHFRGGSVS